MKPNFKIQGKTYFFEDITIRRYYDLQATLAAEDKDKEFFIVEVLTGCPIELLKKIKFQDWLIIWEEALLKIDALKGNTDVIQPILEFKGVKYGLPKIEELTVGEFADLEVFFSSKDSQSRMHEAAAILYRPIVKQSGEFMILEDYDTVKSAERAQEFLDLPVSAIRSANAFFLQSAHSSLRNTLDYLSKSERMNWISQEDRDRLQSLTRLDLGGDYSIPYLETILLDLQNQRSSKFAKPSTGLPIEKTRLQNAILKFKNKLSIK
jgi:hypothetical protein